MSKILSDIVNAERELYYPGRDKHRPTWLADKITTSRRAAHPEQCPRCHANLLVGPDDDRCAITLRVDAEPVDRLTEAVAHLHGTASAELIHNALHYRSPARLQSDRHPHPIHLEHRCPQNAKETLW